jgi:hypothetical protein
VRTYNFTQPSTVDFLLPLYSITTLPLSHGNELISHHLNSIHQQSSNPVPKNKVVVNANISSWKVLTLSVYNHQAIISAGKISHADYGV